MNQHPYEHPYNEHLQPLSREVDPYGSNVHFQDPEAAIVVRGYFDDQPDDYSGAAFFEDNTRQPLEGEY